MKKILALFLSALILVGFAACGENASPDTDTEITEKPASGNSGVVNPWTEATADEIEGYIGYRFGVPENAENVKYFWNETDGISEMQFIIDEIEMTSRAKKTDALEDISGMNYDFSGNDDNYGHGPDIFISNNVQELRGDYYLLSQENECVNLGLWFYQGTAASYSFSLGYITDKGFPEMSQYASEIFILENPQGDPAEYSMDFWAAKYPGENICPFTIDENGTERSYYWVSSFEGWDGTMESWIKQPFNWNGWHKTDDGAIVNEDETLKITDDWANVESMSSCCTVTTEKYEK